MHLDLVQLGLEFAGTQREVSAEILSEGRTPAKLLELAGNAVGFASNQIADYRRLNRKKAKIACKAGCDHCCYLHVDVAPPEAFLIALYLRETLPPDALAATIDRLRDLLLKVDGMGIFERGGAGLPCALLVDRRCSAYAVRPLACNGWTSTSVRACESALTSPDSGAPVDGVVFSIAQGVRDGMQSGLTEAGLSPVSVELTRALLVALVVPDAAARWLQGEPVFDTPVSDLTRLSTQEASS